MVRFLEKYEVKDDIQKASTRELSQENKMTGIQNVYQKDTSEKRAQYKGRIRIEFNQEFYFPHSVLKSRINQLYNSSSP